ncbi:hypothetical protein KH5_13890 [Urechidicola sp. KH5]
MRTITHYMLFIALFLSATMYAQEEEKTQANEEKIEVLEKQKAAIEAEEKALLKEEVAAINAKLSKGEISQEEADKLKQEAAQRRALNIENRTTIIDNKIAYLKRNEDSYMDEYKIFGVTVVAEEDDVVSIRFKDDDYDKPIKYDRRTTSDLVVSFGWNNAVIEGESFNDSPYKFWGSRYFELGWAWKTRLLNSSNALRVKYGFSFQWNGLKLDDNMYFVENGDETVFEEHPFNLKKAKLNITNVIFPVHLEFGPSRKTQTDSYVRYSTRNKFKMGVGGYFGFNIGTYQKLKYTDDMGDKGKDKIKKGYNVSDLVYGLSTYVAFSNVGLYARYELSTIFENQSVDQNLVALGLRFDMN